MRIKYWTAATKNTTESLNVCEELLLYERRFVMFSGIDNLINKS